MLGWVCTVRLMVLLNLCGSSGYRTGLLSITWMTRYHCRPQHSTSQVFIYLDSTVYCYLQLGFPSNKFLVAVWRKPCVPISHLFFHNQCLLITLDVCLWVLQIFNQWNADKTLKLHLCFEWRATDSLSSFCTNNARVNTELVKHFLYTNTVHIKAKCSCIWEAETSVFG